VLFSNIENVSLGHFTIRKACFYNSDVWKMHRAGMASLLVNSGIGKLFKMKILSSIQPQFVPNLYEFLSSVEHKRRYFEEC